MAITTAELPAAELLRNKVTKTRGRATVKFTANLAILHGISITDRGLTGSNHYIRYLTICSGHIKCSDHTLLVRSTKKCF